MKRLIRYIGFILMFVPYVTLATNLYTTVLVRASTQYFSILDASQTGLDPQGDFSMGCWVKMATDPGTQEIIAKDQVLNRSYEFQMIDQGGNNMSLRFNLNNGGTIFDSAKVDFVAATWYHVAFAYHFIASGSSIGKLYVNGVLDSTVSNAVGPETDTAASFAIGNRTYVGNALPFDGKIDDCRFYNTYKTDWSDYNCSLTNTTGLVSEWTFDGQNGNDSVGSNNLTNNNSATFQNTDLPFTATCSSASLPASIQPIFFE